MIFKAPIHELSSIEKKYTKEKVITYIRMVETYCEKEGINLIDYSSSTDFVNEFIKIGVINSDSEILELRMLLKENYEKFVICVSFAKHVESRMRPLLSKLSNYERAIIQKNSKTKKGFTLVDFFCGAGGLSLGFLQEGFNIKLANDIEDSCIETYIFNHPELSSKFVVKDDIKKIANNVHEYINKEIDVIVGGPPCQGFSEANRQRIIDDPRNKLYKYFLKAVENIGPKIVVMENVKGMMRVANQVVEDYKNIGTTVSGGKYGYKADYKVFNSHDFSVAQSRERLIYVAIREDYAEEKGITPSILLNKISENISDEIYTLNYALDNIKPLSANRMRNTNEEDSEISGKKVDVNHYAIHNNPYLNLINSNRKVDYIFNHKSRYCSELNYEIYRRMDQGDNATNDKIKDIMPYSHRNHCFKDKYYKLIGDRPCRTITAHLRMDCHSHIHPYQVRSITPREAARVQSFPDDYLFMGPYLKTYMQIGNAVPPLMSRGIAKVVKNYL